MGFKETNWLPGNERRVLITIALSDPHNSRDEAYETSPGASATLRLTNVGSTGSQANPGPWYDGTTYYYYPFVKDFSARYSASGFSGGSSDSDASFTLTNSRYVFQQTLSGTQMKGGDPISFTDETGQYCVRLSQLFSQYIWQGALVTIYAEVETARLSKLTQQVFKGRLWTAEITEDEIKCTCTEDKKYNRLVPDNDIRTGLIVNKTDYPNAPEGSIGRSIPWVYSKSYQAIKTGPGLCTNSKNLLGLWPGITTSDRLETGTGYETTVYGHRADSSGVAPSGTAACFIYFQDSGLLGWLNNDISGTNIDSAGIWEPINAYQGCDIFININSTGAFSPNGVTNIANAYDGRYSTYATIVYSGGANGKLSGYVPYVGPYGRMKSVKTFLVLDSGGTGVGAPGDTNGQFGIWNTSAGNWHFSAMGSDKNPKLVTANDLQWPSSSYRYLESDAWTTGAGYWDDTTSPWNRWMWEGCSAPDGSGNRTRQDCYFKVEVTVSGAIMRLIACGLKIEFYPAIKLGAGTIRYGMNNYQRTMK